VPLRESGKGRWGPEFHGSEGSGLPGVNGRKMLGFLRDCARFYYRYGEHLGEENFLRAEKRLEDQHEKSGTSQQNVAGGTWKIR